MLKQLRQKKVMKRVLWGLAVIIIPAFVLWGAGGLRETGRYAGKIFGKNISFEEYTNSYNAVRSLGLLTHGRDFQKMRGALMLERAAWDRLILVKEAQKRRIKISDEEIIARIAALPIFQTKEGLFNQSNYTMILGNILRTTPRQFEEEMRESLMIERLMARVFRGTPEPTRKEIEEALASMDPGETSDTEVPLAEKVRENLIASKRMEVYQAWRADLYARAKFTSFIETPEEAQEPQEDAKTALEEIDETLEVTEETLDIPVEEIPIEETTQEETLL